MPYKAFAMTMVLLFGSSSFAATCLSPDLSNMSMRDQIIFKSFDSARFSMAIGQYVRELEDVKKSSDFTLKRAALTNKQKQLESISSRYEGVQFAPNSYPQKLPGYGSSNSIPLHDLPTFISSSKFYPQLASDVSAVQQIIESGPESSEIVRDILRDLKQKACGSQPSHASELPSIGGAQ